MNTPKSNGLTHGQLFTNHAELMAHLQTVGSVNVGCEGDAKSALEHQVRIICVDVDGKLGSETVALIQQHGFKLSRVLPLSDSDGVRLDIEPIEGQAKA